VALDVLIETAPLIRGLLALGFGHAVETPVGLGLLVAIDAGPGLARLAEIDDVGGHGGSDAKEDQIDRVLERSLVRSEIGYWSPEIAGWNCGQEVHCHDVSHVFHLNGDRDAVNVVIANCNQRSNHTGREVGKLVVLKDHGKVYGASRP
jgi:hypothetical protein